MGGGLAFAREDVTQNEFDRWKVKKSKGYRGINLLLEGSKKQWWEEKDVRVAFNLSRISARLERLMGTNVVRVTDRTYMLELRKRIDEDYRNTIAQKIREREIKELEREQILILDGKTDQIPEELANDPIFLVNKRAADEITRRRSKLKTARERNAERLQARGERWERERILHEEQMLQKQEERRMIKKEQKKLEEKYKNEDANRGLDLLRIHDEDWRNCEQQLKEFLENERNTMKARSNRVPTMFSSDPLDLLNIRRAQGAESEEPVKQRKAIKPGKSGECEYNEEPESPKETALVAAKKAKTGSATDTIDYMDDLWEAGDMDELQDPFRSSDASGTSSSQVEPFSKAKGEVINTTKLTARLDNSLQKDVNNGLIVSSDTYNHLCYADPLLVELKETNSIRDIYKLAERIILGRKPVADMPEEGEEEMEEEEED